jgi:hypothetical protein
MLSADFFHLAPEVLANRLRKEISGEGDACVQRLID